MKKVLWTDDNGIKHVSMIRDNDLDENAKMGIPCDPPKEILQLGDEVMKDIWNTLVENGILSYNDVQRSQYGVSSAIQAALKNRIIMLYKLHYKAGGK